MNREPSGPDENLIAPAVKLAEKLADAAREVVMGHFRKPMEIDAKPDDSPVTIADRQAEDAMRALIGDAFPAHGIIGEERTDKNPGAEFVWVLDPIDGTQSFVTGKPLFGTLIALLQRGRPILGIIDMPALNERWIGAAGRPTLFNAEPVTVRACSGVGEAWLYVTSPHMFEDADFPVFERLRKACWRTIYGAECMAYGLLASGLVDIVCEGTMNLYDYAPMVPIIEGAGGVITDWRGNALGMDGDGSVLTAGDAACHTAALELLVR